MGGLFFIAGFALMVFIFKYKKMKNENKALKEAEKSSDIDEKISNKYVNNDHKKEDIKNEGEKSKTEIADADSAADSLNSL